MIQNTPPYWSHIALETASNLGFAKIARYQGLSESQDFLNLLLAFRTMCAAPRRAATPPPRLPSRRGVVLSITGHVLHS